MLREAGYFISGLVRLQEGEASRGQGCERSRLRDSKAARGQGFEGTRLRGDNAARGWLFHLWSVHFCIP